MCIRIQAMYVDKSPAPDVIFFKHGQGCPFHRLEETLPTCH